MKCVALTTGRNYTFLLPVSMDLEYQQSISFSDINTVPSHLRYSSNRDNDCVHLKSTCSRSLDFRALGYKPYRDVFGITVISQLASGFKNYPICGIAGSSCKGPLYGSPKTDWVELYSGSDYAEEHRCMITSDGVYRQITHNEMKISGGIVWVKFAQFGGFFPDDTPPDHVEWSLKGDWTEYGSVTSRSITCDFNITREQFSFKTDRIRNFIYGNFLTLCEGEYTDETDYGKLCTKAVENIHTNHVNTVALTKDLLNFGKSSFDGLSLLKDAAEALPYSGKGAIKSLSGAYLSGKYGDRLTVADARQLSENQLKPSKNGYTASSMDGSIKVLGHTFKGTSRIGIYYKSDPFDWFFENLERSSLTFTALDAWDLVPYSFVADWFFDISGVLESQQKKKWLKKLKVARTYYTFKGSSSFQYSIDGEAYQFYFELFLRICGRTLVGDTYHPSDPTLGEHIIEFGAILLS